MANVLNGACFNVFTVHIYFDCFGDFSSVSLCHLCSQSQFHKHILILLAVLDQFLVKPKLDSLAKIKTDLL